jgi:hypothetical protein
LAQNLSLISKSDVVPNLVEIKTSLPKYHKSIGQIMTNEGLVGRGSPKKAGDQFSRAKLHDRQHHRWGLNAGNARIAGQQLKEFEIGHLEPLPLPNVWNI